MKYCVKVLNLQLVKLFDVIKYGKLLKDVI
jgi:hypothetical protein